MSTDPTERNEYLRRWRQKHPEKYLDYQRKYDAQKREAKQEQHRLLCDAHKAAKEAGVMPWQPDYDKWMKEFTTNATKSV